MHMCLRQLLNSYPATEITLIHLHLLLIAQTALSAKCIQIYGDFCKLTTGKQHAESMMQKQESPVCKVHTLYCLCHTVPYQPWMLLPTSSDFDWLDSILNRFGAVACVNTHYSFLKKLETEQQWLLTKELHPNTFRVVSVDNIDIMQSHAQVYVDNPHRSWHGTSIQIVEPKPLLAWRNVHFLKSGPFHIHHFMSIKQSECVMLKRQKP